MLATVSRARVRQSLKNWSYDLRLFRWFYKEFEEQRDSPHHNYASEATIEIPDVCSKKTKKKLCDFLYLLIIK